MASNSSTPGRANAVVKGTIVDQYADPYLELVHLLQQAAGLEHSLMASYLYAAWSLKPEYVNVRGSLTDASYMLHSTTGPRGMGVLSGDSTLLQVCIEEMQHLGKANRLLVALGVAPNFSPHPYPYASDIYPFPLDLLSMDRYVVATFLWIEAPNGALSADLGEPAHSPAGLNAEVAACLRDGARRHHSFDIADGPMSHVGAIYRRILAVTQRVASNPPGFLPSNTAWGHLEKSITDLMLQGEVGHFRFFERMFTGEAFGSDASIWDPRNPDYPSKNLIRGTAYLNRADTFEDEAVRRLAWLGNLHYWIILSLFDTAYRYADASDVIQRKLAYKAIGNMTQAFWVLGCELAERGAGMPFDPLATQYGLGRDELSALEVIKLLVYEARDQAQRLESDGLLPDAYDKGVFEGTLDGLTRPA